MTGVHECQNMPRCPPAGAAARRTVLWPAGTGSRRTARGPPWSAARPRTASAASGTPAAPPLPSRAPRLEAGSRKHVMHETAAQHNHSDPASLVVMTCVEQHEYTTVHASLLHIIMPVHLSTHHEWVSNGCHAPYLSAMRARGPTSRAPTAGSGAGRRRAAARASAAAAALRQRRSSAAGRTWPTGQWRKEGVRDLECRQNQTHHPSTLLTAAREECPAAGPAACSHQVCPSGIDTHYEIRRPVRCGQHSPGSAILCSTA